MEAVARWMTGDGGGGRGVWGEGPWRGEGRRIRWEVDDQRRRRGGSPEMEVEVERGRWRGWSVEEVEWWWCSDLAAAAATAA